MTGSEYFQVSPAGDVTVVRFVDKKLFDQEKVETMGEQLLHLVDAGARKVLLDLANVAFVSSNAMGMLLRLDMKLKGVGGRVILSNVRPEILELLTMSRLDRVLELRENQAAALREF